MSKCSPMATKGRDKLSTVGSSIATPARNKIISGYFTVLLHSAAFLQMLYCTSAFHLSFNCDYQTCPLFMYLAKHASTPTEQSDLQGGEIS